MAATEDRALRWCTMWTSISSPNATPLKRDMKPRSRAGGPPCQRGPEIPSLSQIARSCTTSEHSRRASIEFYALGLAVPLCLFFCYVLGTSNFCCINCSPFYRTLQFCLVVFLFYVSIFSLSFLVCLGSTRVFISATHSVFISPHLASHSPLRFKSHLSRLT